MTPESDEYMEVLLYAKTFGMTHTATNHPIVGVLELEGPEQLLDSSLTWKDFKFYEWGIVKPLEE